jgi:hypothetical protein
VDGAWARQLAALRSEISKQLAIKSVPGKMAACCGRGPWLPVKPDSTPTIRQRPRRRIDLVGVCRTYASELAFRSICRARLSAKRRRCLRPRAKPPTASGAIVGQNSMRRYGLPPRSSEPNCVTARQGCEGRPIRPQPCQGVTRGRAADRRCGVGGSICSLRPPPRRVVTRGMRMDGLPPAAAKTRLLPGNDSRDACGPGHRRWPQSTVWASDVRGVFGR